MVISIFFLQNVVQLSPCHPIVKLINMPKIKFLYQNPHQIAKNFMFQSWIGYKCIFLLINVNFYRRFVHKLAELAAPMYALTKKEVTFNWDKECQDGFKAIKKLVSQKPILRQPKWDQVFHVYVDASGLALGAIHNLKGRRIFRYIMQVEDSPRQRKPIPPLREKRRA